MINFWVKLIAPICHNETLLVARCCCSGSRASIAKSGKSALYFKIFFLLYSHYKLFLPTKNTIGLTYPKNNVKGEANFKKVNLSGIIKKFTTEFARMGQGMRTHASVAVSWRPSKLGLINK